MDQNLPPSNEVDNQKLKELEKDLENIGKKAKEELESNPPEKPSFNTYQEPRESTPSFGQEPSVKSETPVEQATQAPVEQNTQTPEQPTTSTQPETSLLQQVEETQKKEGGSKKIVVWMATGLLIVSLLASVFYFFVTNGKNTTNVSAPTPTLAPTNTPVVSQTKTYNGKDFSFMYPDGLDLNEDGKMMVVSKTGPTQTEGTEMFDGYAVGFTTETAKMGQTLKSYVDAKIQKELDSGIGDITSYPTKSTFGSYTGYLYKVSANGDYTYVILQNDAGDKFATIYYVAEDPGNLGFEKQAQEIVSSFSFTTEATIQSSPSASSSASPTSSPSI